jgi:hypothetical protein
MQLASRLMALPEASPVWQQAATLEPQACWMGMATTRVVRKGVGREEELGCCSECRWWELTDGNAQAVEADEVLAAVAAGNLLAVAALGGVVLAGDVDLLVTVRGAGKVVSGIRIVRELRSRLPGGRSGEGDSGHGGEDEGLEESHC